MVVANAVRYGTAKAEWVEGIKDKSEEEVAKVVREKAGEKVWVPIYYDYEYDEKGLTDHDV